MIKQSQTDSATSDSFALQQEIDSLHLLRRVALLTACGHNNRTTFPKILELLVSTLGANGGGIYQRPQPNSPLNLVSRLGINASLSRELQKVPAGKGLAHQVITSGTPHVWADLHGETGLYCKAVLDAGWRSLLALPLLAHDQPQGVLFFFQNIPRQFSQPEIDLLKQIGLFIGAGMNTSNLLQKLTWQQRLTQASQRELNRSRQQLREHLKRLETANDALAQLGRMKNHFLALASHELRTPLTCILSAGQLLEECLQDGPADARTLLSSMLQGGERLNILVEDLLDMAKIESRKIYLAHENINLNNLLSQLLQKKQDEANLNKVEIRRGAIPSLLSPCGDQYHLKRALTHILDNAIKFTPRGGSIEIDAGYLCHGEILAMQPQLEPFCPGFFSSRPPPDMIDIRIADTGCGIKERERMHIFEKFHGEEDISLHGRDQSSPSKPTVGLGLPLAKGLIEAHGGLLWSENRADGPGSIFHSMLPLFRRHSQIEIEGS